MDTINVVPQPYWADFKIIVNLYTTEQGTDGLVYNKVDATNIQFKFTYVDQVGDQLVVSFDGNQRVNHKIEDGTIIIPVNSYTFKCGLLKVSRQFSYEDSDFNDGYWDTGSPSSFTNILITE